MPDDALAALLPLLIGGGAGGSGGNMSPDAMGALQAMQTPFAQGETSHAGPVGQITQALMPLVAGPAYAQQARQQQAQQQRDMLIKVLTLTKELKGIDLQDKKLQAEAKALGVNEDFMKRYLDLHGAVHGGATDDMVKNAKMTVGPKGASFTMGGPEKTPNEIALIKQAQAGDTEAQTMLDTILQRKKEVAQAGAEGRAAGTPAKPKKALPPTKIEDYSKAITGVNDLGEVIKGFETNQVSTKDIVSTTVSHGLLATPVLRNYYRFYNDVAKARFGSRDTKAQYERLSKELPAPASFVMDPKNFMDTLRSAQAHLSEGITNTLAAEAPDYDVTALQQRAASFGGGATPSATPSAAPAGGNEKADRAGQMVDMLKAEGKTEQQVIKIMRDIYGKDIVP